jgi:ribosome biogenesis GTPase
VAAVNSADVPALPTIVVMTGRRKTRISLHKNRAPRRRKTDLTRAFLSDEEANVFEVRAERVRPKGDLSRKRTVVVADDDTLAADETTCRRGRVLSVHGLHSVVVTDDGVAHRCYVRRLLKSLETEARGLLTPGDRVWFRPAPEQEGMIVRVEPRDRVLVRQYRSKPQIIAANIEQVLVVVSVAQPDFRPTIIDRYLVCAMQGDLSASICINKADLLEDAALIEPWLELYRGLGYATVLASVVSGLGIDELRTILAGRETVLVGPSGVGKSSLLNVLEPRFHLKVGDISRATKKGRHTTVLAQLLCLEAGGHVIDTPGLRSLAPWRCDRDVLAGAFVEFQPYASACRFPRCTHSHEVGCAVRAAAAEGLVSPERYESYLRILTNAAD